MYKNNLTLMIMLAWAFTAQAAVVFVDITNITATNQSNLNVDINLDGTFDLSFTNNTSTGNGSVAGINGSAVLGNNGITNAARLDYGATISSSGIYNSTYGARLSGVGGQWNVIIGDKYLGVRLLIDGATHYGWVTLNGSSNGQSLTITEVAYNDTPNAPIYAGETSARPQIALNEVVSVLKGQTKILGVAQLNIIDEDNTASEITINLETVPVNGSIELMSSPGVPTSSFTMQQLIDGQVTYVHNGGSTIEDSLTFSFTDSISSAIPANVLRFLIETDELSPNVDIQVAGNVDEGDTLAFSYQLLASTDNKSPANEVMYQVVNYPRYGRLVNLATDPDANITRFSQAAIDSNFVVYLHDGTESLADQFTFYVQDAVGNQTSLRDYDITINAVDDQAPVIKNNRVLLVNVENSATFESEAILAEDDEARPAKVEFSVVAGPSQGVLEVGGKEVNSFTQADINQGRLQYRNTNSSGFSMDSFTFTVADSNNNSTELHTFLIYVFDIDVILSLGELPAAPLQFNVYPNPAVDFIQIEGLNALQSAEIYSPEGKLQRVQRQGNQLDVQGLSQGNYIVLVKNELNHLVGQAQFLKR